MAGGSFLTKKMAGAPGYVWVLGGMVAVGAVVYYEKKKKANAAAAPTGAAAAAGAATTGAASTPYGPSGGGGIDPGTLAAILSSQGAGSTASSSTSTSGGVASVGPLEGSGYLPPGGTAGSGTGIGSLTATDNQGNIYTWVTPAQAGAIGYQNLYAELVPGVFSPYNAQQMPGILPLYALTKPAAPAA